MLALENVDVPFINSVEKVMRFVQAVNSPWFQAYPDMGNMAAAGYDPVSQLRLAKSHLVGVHVKDALPGVVRGVPFETGIVPFHDVFKTLEEMGFWAPLAVEMWADMDSSGDPFIAAVQARKLVDHLVKTAWGNLE
jgi:L-ribulose-5-phosphate 3-epimerase